MPTAAFAYGVRVICTNDDWPAQRRMGAPGDIVQSGGRFAASGTKVSHPASPVFVTGTLMLFEPPAVTLTGAAPSSGYGSMSTPGPRTSKYARMTSPLAPMARTARFEA